MQPVPIENLLIHADFVRELARALVPDPHERADLEQEAWLQAMRRPPVQSTSLRGWLTALVGSLWRNRARERQRRRVRELASAPPPDADPVDVLLDREQVRQRLLAAVLRMPEPFRAAILLRYYEELSPAQIARRLGIPAATVRTRVARGLERLRAELDAEHGGKRAAWAMPLITFPGAPTPAPMALTELLLMKKTVAVGAVALLAAASFVLAWWVWFVPPSQPSLPAGSPAQAPSLAHADPATGTNQVNADQAVARRTAADSVASSVGAMAEPGADGELLVDVVWADGAPAAGVQVHVGVRDGGRRPLATAITDELGQVRTRVAIGTVAVTADRQSEAVEGKVSAGAPLGAAVVRAFPKPIDESFLMMGQYDYASTFGYPSATADENGRYRLPGVAPGEVQLYAGPMRKQARWGEVVPWAHATVAIAAGSMVEWNPKAENGPTIRGVVRYRDGAPMPDSFVNLARPGEARGNAVVTDKQGRFCFIKLQARAYDVSVQVWDPPKGASPIEARDVWPDRGELELVATYDAPKQLVKGAVKGRVVDSGGRCPNAAALRVVLVADERSWNHEQLRDDGAFVFADVAPGHKRILVMNGEESVLIGETFELQPAETKDLGALTTTPGGKLRLVIEREPGTEAAAPTLYLRPAGSSHSRKVAIGTANELELDNLCLGEHTFSAWQEDLVSIGGTCHVEASSMATCRITLRRAVSRELVVEYDAGQRVTKVEVLDQRGAVVWAFTDARLLERPFKGKPNLPLGSFMLRAHTAAGVAEQAFTLTSYEPDQPPVVVRAK